MNATTATHEFRPEPADMVLGGVVLCLECGLVKEAHPPSRTFASDERTAQVGDVRELQTEAALPTNVVCLSLLPRNRI
jgi:hypothetical protein